MEKIDPLDAFDTDAEGEGQQNLIDELVRQGKIHPDAARQLLDAGQDMDGAKECDVSILGGQFTVVDLSPEETPVGTPVTITIKGYVRQIGPKLMAGTGLRHDAKITRTSIALKVAK